MRIRITGGAFVLLLLLLSFAAPGCRRAPAAATAETQVSPTVRLYAFSAVAGALEPCGCTKDMLGGIDHLAAFVAGQAKDAPHSLLVAAGPLLFLDPKGHDDRRAQDLWKAEALAQSFADLGLLGWAPGANDWAYGPEELERLRRMTRADLLGGNLAAGGTVPRAARIVERNGYRIGFAGVSDPRSPLGVPPGVEVRALAPALQAARAELDAGGAQIRVAMVAADRGQAMRLVEQVPGFHVVVVGKPYDQGEGNDATIPPVLVGATLVVQSPNHLQGVAVVDLFVRGTLVFQDGTGIAAVERRESLTTRISDLEARLRQWEASQAASADVAARRKDLEMLRRELHAMKEASPPSEGSFFRYRLQEVRERLGRSEGAAKRMTEYYRRVNDHNREAFKDRVPPVPRPGEAKYVGADACVDCHAEAHAFWLTTAHAKAYGTLLTQHKEFNLDCVACHVTGYGKPGGSTVTHVKGLESVQCEVCHGPGSRHLDDPDDLTALVRSPPKTLCAPSCHHPPHVPEAWDVDLAWKGILGKGHGASK